MYPEITEKIVSQVVKFNLDPDLFRNDLGDWNSLRHAMYCLCATNALQQSTITTLLPFVRRTPRNYLDPGDMVPSNSTADVTWVYRWLEELYTSKLQDTVLIHDLTQVLFSYTPIQTTPSTTALRVLLSTLTFDGCIDQSTKYLTLRVLLAAHHWFQDSDLRALLQEQSVWSALGACNSDREPDITIHYIALGVKLSKILEWKTIISQNLPGWLSHLPRLLEIQEREIPTQEFCAVLACIWDVDMATGEQFKNEMPIVMAFTALASFWNQFDITQGTHHLIPHIRSTVSTALLARIRPDEVVIGRRHDWRPHTVTQRFKDIIIIRLGDAVMRAADRVSQAFNLNPDLDDTVTAAAELLSRLGWMIVGELKHWPLPDSSWAEKTEVDHWTRVRQAFYNDIESLFQLFPNTVPVSVELSD